MEIELNNPILSIIVPFFNSELFLERCIQSLYHQDIPAAQYEVLLIDDGSHDNSLQIAKRLVDQYSNIRLYSFRNAGPSAARNRGVKYSLGKYILFVDSDDKLFPNVLGKLLETIENNKLDILRFRYRMTYQQSEVYDNALKYSHFSNIIQSGEDFLVDSLGYCFYVCQFIFKRKVVEREPFYDSIFMEDMECLPRILIGSSRVSSCDLYVYEYIIREDSISQNSNENYKKKIINDKMLIISRFLNRMSSVSNKCKEWYQGLLTQIVISIISEQCCDKSIVVQLLEIKGLFPLSKFRTTRKSFLMVSIANTNLLLAYYIYQMKNRIRRTICRA